MTPVSTSRGGERSLAGQMRFVWVDELFTRPFEASIDMMPNKGSSMLIEPTVASARVRAWPDRITIPERSYQARPGVQSRYLPPRNSRRCQLRCRSRPGPRHRYDIDVTHISVMEKLFQMRNLIEAAGRILNQKQTWSSSTDLNDSLLLVGRLANESSLRLQPLDFRLLGE
jgi:hypothetical protein